MRNLTITLIQAGLAWHDVRKNLDRFDAIIRGIEGATDCVLLPEMFTTGFTMHPEEFAEDMGGPAVERLVRWAELRGADVAGSVIIKEGGRYFNRLVWARPGGDIVTYDKRHLFRMAGEDEVYGAGAGARTIDLHGWKLRPFICYDLRFPVWTRDRGQEYDVAVFVANWPAQRSLHWKTLLRARAIENLCYVAGVNRTGADGNGIAYSGDSAVIDFAGNAILDMKDEEGARTVELSYEALRRYRESFPAWKDADAFTLDT
jgi:omega-amidase